MLKQFLKGNGAKEHRQQGPINWPCSSDYGLTPKTNGDGKTAIKHGHYPGYAGVCIQRYHSVGESMGKRDVVRCLGGI